MPLEYAMLRIVLGLAGGVTATIGVAGIIGILAGKTMLAGAKGIDEFTGWHWNDSDQATAVLRTRAHLFSVILVSGLLALSFAIFGRQFEGVLLLGWCLPLLVIGLWWWLEREFAWPGLLVAREAQGTRGLFFARRDARRRLDDGGDEKFGGR